MVVPMGDMKLAIASATCATDLFQPFSLNPSLPLPLPTAQLPPPQPSSASLPSTTQSYCLQHCLYSRFSLSLPFLFHYVQQTTIHSVCLAWTIGITNVALGVVEWKGRKRGRGRGGEPRLNAVAGVVEGKGRKGERKGRGSRS